jgi:hypothetical protein
MLHAALTLAQQGLGQRLARLRKLTADDVSLERAHHTLQQHHFQGCAAAATVEALVFGLRERETAALREPKVRRRIGELSEQQMHEVCARLQKLTPEIAAPWSADKVERLVEAWAALHAR